MIKEQVKEIQDSYFQVQNQFGQLNIAKMRVEEQFSGLDKTELELRNKFKELQEKEKIFLDEITKKYGEGTLNPETGEFVTTKSN